ncbi:MAG: hypothetical protein JNK45_11745 [Myxococcales bacterium]|nr:hypothetical protein [Myxococcales bacterium]
MTRPLVPSTSLALFVLSALLACAEPSSPADTDAVTSDASSDGGGAPTTTASGTQGSTDPAGTDATLTGADTQAPGSSDGTDAGDTSGPGVDDTGEPPPPPSCYRGEGNPAITALASGTWLEVEGTVWLDHCACEDGFPEACGNGYCAGEFAYSGAAMSVCHDAVVMWGGGHNDYWGNEVYWLPLDTMQWERLTDPSDPGNGCTETYADGTPASRHTYDGLAFIDHAGRLFANGGAIACGEGGAGDGSLWTFDVGTRTWHDMDPTPTNFDSLDEIAGYFPFNFAADYDPNSGLVYLEANWGLYAYDFDANEITFVTNTTPDQGGVWSERTAVVVPDRRLMLSIGGGAVRAYDLEAGTLEVWQTTGPDAIVTGDAPGLAYDPSHDQVVGWSHGDVFRLDLDARTWAADGAPSPVGGAFDVYGRFAYSAVHDAFVAVADPEQNVAIYRN